MAKGAAKEQELGGLHSALAQVFKKVLKKYERNLDIVENMTTEELTNEMVGEIEDPNPAMLSAIAKFLKDNEISMDSESVDELNSTSRRLKERREARAKAGMNLSVVPPVETG